jgi:hypothetical protein
MVTLRNFLLFGVALLAGISGAHAQSGKIAGRVIDAVTGDPLPGVNVVITEKWIDGTAVPAPDPIGAASDPGGYYTILNVGPGLYTLRASFIGYASLVKMQIPVNSGLTTTVDFAMAEAVIEGEEVQVVAQRNVVRADVASTVEYISPVRVAQSPTNRIDEFIGKIKGIQLISDAQGHGLSVRGGGIRETDIRIDGLSVRDPRSGNSYLGFNTATVEEIQVKTGGFEARYGGIQSGLVNLITKEGSRDRFTSSLRFDYVPAEQRRFYGVGPWERESPVYQTFAGKYALTGVPDSAVIRPGNPHGEIPDDPFFTSFRGWNHRTGGILGFTGPENLAVWKATHPVFDIAARPDYFIEGALTGPFPIPKTTFLFGAKYENTQFAFPLGPRDNYVDWNSQLKLTTRFSPSTKLALSGMYAKIETINSGSTSSYGGAVIGQTDRFNFLTNTKSSVVQQASLIGSAFGFQNLFNVGRTQFVDKQLVLGGAKLTHSLSSDAFFNLEGQFSYSDNLVRPFMFDTSTPNSVFRVSNREFFNLPMRGYPDGNVTPVEDIAGVFRLTGGAIASDSSYSWSLALKGDFTRQLGRHHLIEGGFDFSYDHLFVYSGVTRLQTFSYEPGFFQYYTATPVDLALYVQDKLEYQGMVATIGLRAEYFNPMRHGYDVSIPLDQNFRDVYTRHYFSLPGETNSYERWVAWRETLDAPPGWPETETKGRLKLSPRIGTAFPITTSSKLYFNYGIFYQRPYLPFLYNQVIQPGRVTVPTPGLDFEKTTAFEFGYEQSFFNNYLINLTFYYKDVTNRPLPVTYYSYHEDVVVNTYSNDAYRDIRGIEMRFEKNFGRFLTFWANYDYQVTSSGQTGLGSIFENELKKSEQERFPNMFRGQPLPRAFVSVNLHTPNDFGPRILGNYPLGGFYVNPLYEWREGGYTVWNPEEANPDKQLRVDILDYSNLDLRVSKMLNVPGARMELVATVENVFDTRRLYTGNMLPGQLTAYKNSLKLPFKGEEFRGDDKWGEWDKEHIDVGWYTAPVFLNPRRYSLGLRLLL